MIETLFGLIPAASRGQQWLAEDLQLVNWGGYDGGPHRVRFSPGATLLCGGSGSGKSTLMDGYVALMMPHTTPFNGASNGAVVGRPRGLEQRNIISYGRGKTDETRTEDGTRLEVLRGDGVDTWCAIAMTWVDHDDSRFTAVRAWYIPAGARVLEDTIRVRATVHGAYDLKSLEPAADLHLTDAAVRAAGLDVVATDREFSARLHHVLGIGAAGAGTKAMNLLARIQAGQQITTVDDLYKKMVLEEPGTLTTADEVVTHLDALEGTRDRMVTAAQQVRALEPIRGMRTRIEDATERLRVINAVGQFTDPSSLATLWKASRRLDLLRDVEAELMVRQVEASNRVREVQVLTEAAELERDGLADILRTSGGDRLDNAQRELRRLDGRLADVQRDRRRLDEALATLNVEARTKDEFGKLYETAVRALHSTDAKAEARRAYAEANNAAAKLEDEVKALKRERVEVANFQGSIPHRHRESRAMLAEAAGLTLEDLAFVGELVEVLTEFEPWREAFNLALGGFATKVLIDVAHVPAFRTAIDSVRTPVRIQYEGVHTGLPQTDGDIRTLRGRLVYKNTPFTGRLQEILDERFDFVCVDSSDELSRHRQALTVRGQSTSGNNGAHGGHGRDNVLGFSNQRSLTELDQRIAIAEAAFEEATTVAAGATAALDLVDSTLSAYEKIRDLTWEQVDIDSLESDRARWATIIDEITSSNPEIMQLKARIQGANAKANDLRESIGSIKDEHERLGLQWSSVIDEVDFAQGTVDDAQRAGRELAVEQIAYLDAQFMVPESSGSRSRTDELALFDAALQSASTRLANEREAAQAQVMEQRESLRRVFATFIDRWPNQNLLTDPDKSFGDFVRILTDLETSGLHELETEWRNSLLRLSGNDLTNLDSTLARSLREIRERIEPINRIMQDLPFYDDDHRLQITIRDTTSEARSKFRRELRDVRGAIEAASTDEERERVYERMKKLIGKMRRTSPEFHDLIDVRNHVRISAERIHATTKQHVALYDHIGEKSGGESQELIAFIVGAALRYQLGDADAVRPRYAPVLLDEALIKADAHFTKRAIGAWRGLGFQLVIGAPNDKYSAIEPYVDVEYDILKDKSGRSRARLKVGLPELTT